MTSYTDYCCGIEGLHWHTGIMKENYTIEYFCPFDHGGCNPMGRAWMTNSLCSVTLRRHEKCRTVSTTTEEIAIVFDVLPDFVKEEVETVTEETVEEYLKRELKRMLEEEFQKQFNMELEKFFFGDTGEGKD